MLELLIILLIVLIILSAFFSGTETALMSMTMIKVRSLVKQKKKGSDVLFRLKQDPHKLLIIILIGNNLVNIFAASVATVIFIDLFGYSGVGIATGVMTFLVLVFGEITPKTLAMQNAEKISLLVAKPIEVLSYIMSPFISFFELISKGISKLIGSGKEENLSEEELKTIVTIGREEGLLNKDIAEMMHNILEFEGTRVEEIMTTKTEIAFVEGDSKLGDVLDYIIKKPYSRYPVYEKIEDQVVGILDVDDILKYVKQNKLNVKVKTIAREVSFVPETKEIGALLAEFQKKEVPMSIVVDEYGDVLGLVTMEDILEEIVGDIFDKSARRDEYVQSINDKVMKADAKVTIEQMEKILGVVLKEKHFNTLAGFIEHKLGRIPKKGEKIDLAKVSIIVEKATKQRVEKVKIIRK